MYKRDDETNSGKNNYSVIVLVVRRDMHGPYGLSAEADANGSRTGHG